MVNISKRKVKTEVLDSISKQFVSFVAGLRTKEDTRKFLDELLTKAEMLQLTKRFAILVMLEMGYRFKDIISTLKVSPSTISRVQDEADSGECEHMIKHIHIILGDQKTIKGSDEYTALRAYFKTLFLPLPPIGRYRWKNLEKMELIDNKKKEYKERRNRAKNIKNKKSRGSK